MAANAASTLLTEPMLKRVWMVAATLSCTEARPKACCQTMAPFLSRSEEHTSELQSLMRISYAVFCLKKKKYMNSIQQSNQYIRQEIGNAPDYSTTLIDKRVDSTA